MSSVVPSELLSINSGASAAPSNAIRKAPLRVSKIRMSVIDNPLCLHDSRVVRQLGQCLGYAADALVDHTQAIRRWRCTSWSSAPLIRAVRWKSNTIDRKSVGEGKGL